MLLPPRHSQTFTPARGHEGARGIGSHGVRDTWCKGGRQDINCIKQDYRRSTGFCPWSPSQEGARDQSSFARRGLPSKGCWAPTRVGLRRRLLHAQQKIARIANTFTSRTRNLCLRRKLSLPLKCGLWFQCGFRFGIRLETCTTFFENGWKHFQNVCSRILRIYRRKLVANELCAEEQLDNYRSARSLALSIPPSLPPPSLCPRSSPCFVIIETIHATLFCFPRVRHQYQG